MSNRTKHLAPTNKVSQLIRNLRYHEASRQWLAIVLIILFTVFGKPHLQWLFWFGVILIVEGTLVRLWASGHVKKNKQLATDGPYALVRHPLYVGNILMLVGFSLASQIWWSLLLTVGLLAFYYPTAISYEDLKLQRLFGEDWDKWRAKTKALLPKWRSGNTLSSSWSLRQSAIGNGEPIIVIFATYCCYVLFMRL